nr:hypothetical protein P9270_015715 [Mesorhizobium sp. WSM4875]
MIFAGMRDSHDKLADRVQEKLGDACDGTPAELLTNMNLVGIRRRLNNIEVGVWVLVLFVAAHVWRHW